MQLLTLHEAVCTFHSDRYNLPKEILEKGRNAYPVHAISAELEKYLVRGLGGQEYAARNVMLPNGIVAGEFLNASIFRQEFKIQIKYLKPLPVFRCSSVFEEWSAYEATSSQQ